MYLMSGKALLCALDVAVGVCDGSLGAIGDSKAMVGVFDVWKTLLCALDAAVGVCDGSLGAIGVSKAIVGVFDVWKSPTLCT